MTSSPDPVERGRCTELACGQCRSGRMVRSRVLRSPAVRVVGYALWADALVTLMLTAAGSWLATPRHEPRTLLKAETVGWLRTQSSLPAAVADEFMERGSITPETFALVPPDDRWALHDRLELYQARAARSAVIEAIGGFADVRMWWCSATLFLVGGMLLRRRSAWSCDTCGASSERPRRVAHLRLKSVPAEKASA